MLSSFPSRRSKHLTILSLLVLIQLGGSDAFAGKARNLSDSMKQGLIERCMRGFALMARKVQPPAIADRNPRFLDDYQYIEEKRYLSQLGRLNSEYDEQFKTRVYFPNTARPDANGNVPRVDPEAKALYIYFHGSGTDKAGGANFAYKQNKLAEMGYTSIGFDLPFHKEGPVDKNLMNSDDFMKWLDGFIQAHKQPGQPVYLVGHSFGPDLIAEYLKRYPSGVDGAALISPASFTPELKKWYDEKTSKMMNFWADTKENEAGGKWAGVVTSDFTWSKPPTYQSPDPTIVNPNLKVRVLTGDMEEYVPGPLNERGLPAPGPRDYDLCAAIKKFFANATCTTEEGVGHYIFMHQDKQGNDVILREFLALNGQEIGNAKALKTEASARKLSDSELLAQRYAREPFLRAWMDQTYGKDKLKELLANNDTKGAQQLTRDFRQVVTNRENQIAENMRKTREWAPEFYNANKDDIENINKDNLERLMGKYFEYLEQVSPQVRATYALGTEEAYKLPERSSGPPPGWVPRDKKEKPAKKKPQTGDSPAQEIKPEEGNGTANPDPLQQILPEGDRGPASKRNYTPMPRWFSVPMIDLGA